MAAAVPSYVRGSRVSWCPGWLSMPGMRGGCSCYRALSPAHPAAAQLFRDTQPPPATDRPATYIWFRCSSSTTSARNLAAATSSSAAESSCPAHAGKHAGGWASSGRQRVHELLMHKCGSSPPLKFTTRPSHQIDMPSDA